MSFKRWQKLIAPKIVNAAFSGEYAFAGVVMVLAEVLLIVSVGCNPLSKSSGFFERNGHFAYIMPGAGGERTPN